MREIVIVFILLIAFSCKKDEESSPNKPIGNIPQISFVSALPNEVKEYTDSIIFIIEYLDGDGDIGYEDADSTSLYLTDNRVPFTEKYHIPPLTPAGSNITIQGQLRIVLNHTAILDSANTTETTSYSIKLKDRAGNWSNTTNTGGIKINK